MSLIELLIEKTDFQINGRAKKIGVSKAEAERKKVVTGKI